mmetsp:Transcript_55001/g.174898  ORF Transcript_55001/g.174898 Transcript_55001/m.174898 type:complete len:300 (-) Transcript_55001:109-1008(-)
MKDRGTGRPRGFGFVVFANPEVADQVASEHHTIDGRQVEAKKAVPRDGSPLGEADKAMPAESAPDGVRTKKIFVGGLSPSVTEEVFRLYFEQFGPIVDGVVMYDHASGRPRGFGFVTYEMEESVDRVLALGSMQDFGDKKVEIKRAVPKEQMPQLPRPTMSRESMYGVMRGAPTWIPPGPSPPSYAGYPMAAPAPLAYAPGGTPPGLMGGYPGAPTFSPPQYNPSYGAYAPPYSGGFPTQAPQPTYEYPSGGFPSEAFIMPSGSQGMGQGMGYSGGYPMGNPGGVGNGVVGAAGWGPRR